MTSLRHSLLLVGIAVLALAGPSAAMPGYNQGFETDNAGWDVFGGSFDAVRVPSGTNGVPSASGSFHAESSTNGGAAGNLGGYYCCFPPLGFNISVDVYLDFSLADGNDRRFNYTVAINSTECGHLSDFVFALGTRPGFPGQWIASASQNCPGWPSDPGRNPQVITSGTGWYTLKHTFTNQGGNLNVKMEIIDFNSVTVATYNLPSAPIPISAVSGHRYAWFCAPEAGAGYSALPFIAFDNSRVSSDECPVPTTRTSWGKIKAHYR